MGNPACMLTCLAVVLFCLGGCGASVRQPNTERVSACKLVLCPSPCRYPRSVSINRDGSRWAYLCRDDNRVGILSSQGKVIWEYIFTDKRATYDSVAIDPGGNRALIVGRLTLLNNDPQRRYKALVFLWDPVHKTLVETKTVVPTTPFAVWSPDADKVLIGDIQTEGFNVLYNVQTRRISPILLPRGYTAVSFRGHDELVLYRDFVMQDVMSIEVATYDIVAHHLQVRLTRHVSNTGGSIGWTSTSQDGIVFLTGYKGESSLWSPKERLIYAIDIRTCELLIPEIDIDDDMQGVLMRK